MLENIPVSFALPDASKPLISIVIPVYNQYAFTHACVYSILKFTPKNIPYEVLILDDCSTDETKEIASRIQNIRVFRNDTNQGFLKNCNTYIPKARGKYIFLMNNDMEVTAGWLEPLLKNIRKRGVGIVGSCILNIEGTIQAAGSSLLSNGTPMGNYRGLEAKYLKNKIMDVHYMSGCCLMFRRSLWDKLKGFDELFLPAYYEDTDFSMRTRFYLKKRVLCAADSQIYHYENISYHEKTNELCLINKEKFFNRWKRVLEPNPSDFSNLSDYWDRLWRRDDIRILGIPLLHSYYADGRKTYYLGNIKLFSKKFSYD